MNQTALFLDPYLRGPEDDLKGVETCSPKYISVRTVFIKNRYIMHGQ
jgi:hypothetical protein